LQGADCNDATPAILRTYPELNRWAIAEGVTALYRLWLLVRALDTDGRGVVSRHALVAAMEAHGLSRRHLHRIQQHPQLSVFLTIHPDKIEYRSLKAVCLALQVKPGRSVYVPASCVGSLETFRAHLYAAWIAAHDCLLISRERLSGLFQVSPETLRRWERTTGVVVTYNVVEVGPTDAAAATAHLPQDARLDGDRLDRVYTWEYQGHTYYQTVNRYAAPQLQRAATGNVKKVAKAVSVLPVADHGDGTKRRIFYDRQTTPARYQEQPGASLRDTERTITTPRGPSRLWRFQRFRPAARRSVLG
jgi:hypothetical protein